MRYIYAVYLWVGCRGELIGQGLIGCSRVFWREWVRLELRCGYKLILGCFDLDSEGKGLIDGSWVIGNTGFDWASLRLEFARLSIWGDYFDRFW